MKHTPLVQLSMFRNVSWGSLLTWKVPLYKCGPCRFLLPADMSDHVPFSLILQSSHQILNILSNILKRAVVVNARIESRMNLTYGLLTKVKLVRPRWLGIDKEFFFRVCGPRKSEFESRTDILLRRRKVIVLLICLRAFQCMRNCNFWKWIEENRGGISF